MVVILEIIYDPFPMICYESTLTIKITTNQKIRLLHQFDGGVLYFTLNP